MRIRYNDRLLSVTLYRDALTEQNREELVRLPETGSRLIERGAEFFNEPNEKDSSKRFEKL